MTWRVLWEQTSAKVTMAQGSAVYILKICRMPKNNKMFCEIIEKIRHVKCRYTPTEYKLSLLKFNLRSVIRTVIFTDKWDLAVNCMVN